MIKNLILPLFAVALTTSVASAATPETLVICQKDETELRKITVVIDAKAITMEAVIDGKPMKLRYTITDTSTEDGVLIYKCQGDDGSKGTIFKVALSDTVVIAMADELGFPVALGDTKSCE